jgi:hypothetical protein
MWKCAARERDLSGFAKHPGVTLAPAVTPVQVSGGAKPDRSSILWYTFWQRYTMKITRSHIALIVLILFLILMILGRLFNFAP